MIQTKVQAASDQVLDHPKAALGTVDWHGGFCQREAFRLVYAFRKFRAMIFNPLPVLGPTDPVSSAIQAIE
jgi:hypothetical protein